MTLNLLNSTIIITKHFTFYKLFLPHNLFVVQTVIPIFTSNKMTAHFYHCPVPPLYLLIGVHADCFMQWYTAVVIAARFTRVFVSAPLHSSIRLPIHFYAHIFFLVIIVFNVPRHSYMYFLLDCVGDEVVDLAIEANK